MDQAQFLAAIEAVFAQSPSGSGNLIDRMHYTNDGVLGTASETCGTIGFGIAAEISPSQNVLSTVSDLNRLMTFGHYWLAEGADNSNWSLVCGFKFQHETSNVQQVIEISAGLVQHSRVIVDSAREQLGDASHRQYWLDDVPAEAQALILTGHLG
ncbi:hypothetical protein [Rhodococcus sp. 4CII]|uniref:hypothetical protein n=1 Tax=Rhodococcus sp. 4CII TaxID=2834580 RepID=UPI00163D49F5|nr:hypothetical protein [Rhodococcus sp. 4CII]MBC2898436.1 hypothetical protein [Rhodococcus sp. 4CII]